MVKSGRQSPGVAESEGVDLVGYHELEGRPAFKLAMQEVGGRWFLYASHFWTNGWSVIEVTNPTSPEYLTFVGGPAHTWTLQVQVADGTMITALERPGLGWSYDPSRTEQVGVLVWDVSNDPANPTLLAHYDTSGRGTHRNHYSGGRYAYLTSQPDGFKGNMLLVLDLADRAHPVEAGRWWWPGQWEGDEESADEAFYLHGPPYVDGDVAYLSYGRIGAVILDVSNRSQPRFLSRISFGDFGSIAGCHSVVPYGDGIVVANTEAIAEGGDEPLQYAVTIDARDLTAPRVVGWFPKPTPPEGVGFTDYAQKGGRFGPHNQHHYQSQPALLNNPFKVFMTYFNAGLRIFDIADPANPIETGSFVPNDPEQRRGPKPETALVTQIEDVLVDRRGYIYCTDKNHGLFVLKER